MKSPATYVCVLVVISFLASSSAFAPKMHVAKNGFTNQARPELRLNMGLLSGDDEPKVLTRESEPEQFFSTNTDKMSDEEKLPIALAGLVGISLPFILGLIALFAAK